MGAPAQAVLEAGLSTALSHALGCFGTLRRGDLLGMRLDADPLKRRARSLYGSLPRPLRRVSVLLLGTLVLAAGLLMLVLPGPGLLVIGLAVAVLALEFDWARRVAERGIRLARGLDVRRRLSR